MKTFFFVANLGGPSKKKKNGNNELSMCLQPALFSLSHVPRISAAPPQLPSLHLHLFWVSAAFFVQAVSFGGMQYFGWLLAKLFFPCDQDLAL